ncbi:bifunctional proline dehydrogenase/L-glutamate gamma-semialdehyde dehydrogenase PutA [Dasania sp. GY-MA-18]|uniref:Bifunctional protein PutA n=1 Tax=Dasania phycosphaerae TaxID=2950436 RepID=A0A9J6RPG6_9GAMM|nr:MULTISPECIES: bifunctional proline dehydrogenase/L-glutamate gamma-semialdehyde dehydrogenase PutA [Dasania]MCR8923800.1 bifunctional proline dehydrogenase/L-glutamate gamma-semialdehyde dehydrogenase PutA [Dasania sp. GY-MA-18]MCZ0866234.1 bifunctional proline dehydrogenase/L-glutamate gamma-semialdehyde dehydrogenase PutA [Dasania phycosphaerae]MCZ0869958.1 bifunctional proline dehydrogenase/L-glutamate gamma-semialdehyde dehydrogenase PutA [Dasania phycosphaerae]
MQLPRTLDTTSPLRQTIRQHYRADEAQVLEGLLAMAEVDKPTQGRIANTALALAGQVRRTAQKGGHIQNLLNQYSLSTNEGIVLMCLAEALLRVPDSTTADRLIRDKLISGDWQAHLGKSDSFFVNASAWGLLLSGRIVRFNPQQQQQHINSLKSTLAKLGEPVIRSAMRQAMGIMGNQFVLGRSIAEASKRATKLEAKGYRYSYDMLGEAARTMADADNYFKAYQTAIAHIGANTKGSDIYKSAGISVKLSAIHPRYELLKSERVMDELVSRLKSLAIMAKDCDIGFTIDAEEADRLDLSLDVIEAVFTAPELAGWEGFGLVVQAYQKRALPVLQWVIDLSKRTGKKMMLRLVKGAYWDSEIKIAQVEGLDGYPVFTRKAATDVSYQACAGLLLDNRDVIYPQFATHNAYSVAYILERALQGNNGGLSGFEFQRLHGMGDGLYDDIISQQGIPVRIYAPVGEHKSLLAYLVRRLLENGANSSFVNSIVDDELPLSSLVQDPIAKVRSWSQIPNPNIPLPINLYGDERSNSHGIDLSDIPRLQRLASNSQTWAQQHIKTAADFNLADKTLAVSSSPTDTRHFLGAVPRSSAQQLSQKLDQAAAVYQQWSKLAVDQRAACLERLADKLEQHMDELIALCTHEAGKIVADGVAEVREAVDFCRYYAVQARKVCGPHPQWGEHGQLQSRGVVLCISPWNFPLAIFLGQVTAALAAGNTVLAKPADTTCLIASRALALMSECGFPDDVVQLIVTPGPQVGELLLPDPRIAAVMFTGSTGVGEWIAHKLAERSGPRIPLIAETGGQNCMIVDSTALPEQVVDDVIASGFQSAGQRCSALRVLFLQEDIADEIIEMIIGAMQELHIGDPNYLHTDIGPVIDNKALSALQQHAQYLDSDAVKGQAKLLYQCKLSDECQHGTFFAPRLYEIDSINVLQQEVFGPIVHIVRYPANQFEQALADINSTGFGLTAGVHSRIQHTAEKVVNTINAGNIYINRNTIGAVVGVQPFGGHGLSGTGPKAGGPSYVYRLTQNTTASSSDTAIDTNTVFSKLAHPTGINVASNPTAHYLHIAGKHIVDIAQRAEQVKNFSQLLINDSGLKLTSDFANHINIMVDQALSSQLKAATLTGPTGELNQLMLTPRGNLLCLQMGDHYVEHGLRQLCAALLCGNRVVQLSDNALDYSKLIAQAGLQSAYQRLSINSERQLQNLLLAEHCHGLVFSGPISLQKNIDQLLSQRSGALLPFITESHGPAMMHRFVLEKSISNNTTASGGNAALLAMSEP